MSQPIARPFEPNAAAQAWRDMSASDRKEEREVRIASAIAATLLVIGIAIGGYSIWRWMPINNIPLVTPFSMLVAPAVAFSFIGIFYKKSEQNGKNPSDLSLSSNRLECLKKLKTLSFEEMHRTYSRNNGGLGPLVRHGLLTTEEGTQLGAYFEEWVELEKSYADTSKDKQRLQEEWEKMKTQFSSEHTID